MTINLLKKLHLPIVKKEKLEHYKKILLSYKKEKIIAFSVASLALIFLLFNVIKSRYQQQTGYLICNIRPLQKGEKIKENDLAVCPHPKNYRPPFAILPSQANLLFGQQLALDLPLATPILWPFIDDQTKKRFSASLPAGTRAIVLSAAIVRTIDSNVQAGDLLDFLAIFSGAGTGESVVLPILQKIMICHVEYEEIAENSKKLKKVSIAISSEQAFILLQAEARAKIRAILRRHDDNSDLPLPSFARLRKYLGELPLNSLKAKEIEIIRPATP